MAKKKKKRNIKLIGTIIGIIVIILCILGYMLIKDLKQEDILRAEVQNLSKKDFTTDRYNTSIKTRGDYAVVEKTIKEYLDEYATDLQSLSDITKDEKIKSILSADNYQKDGPDFNSTKKYLQNTKADFNTKINSLTSKTSEEEIMQKIEDKKLDKYYVDLYKELMLSESADTDFKKSLESLKELSETINNILDTEEAVIDLLISEKGKWTIEEGKIVFQSTDALNRYNELIKDYQNNG